MITYNGVNLEQEYSCNIFRTDSDASPARDINRIAIPGRSGGLILDNGKFPDVEMSYTAVFYEENADANASNLKNFLLSQVGYKRMTDTEHPSEFYMATIYKNIKPELTDDRTKIKMDLIFIRKPQRYLVSGETVYNWARGTQVVSGHELTVPVKDVDRSFLEWEWEFHGSQTSRIGRETIASLSSASTMNIIIKQDSTTYTNDVISFGVGVTKAHLDVINGSLTVYERLANLPQTGWTLYRSESENQRYYYQVTAPANWDSLDNNSKALRMRATSGSTTNSLFYNIVSTPQQLIDDVTWYGMCLYNGMLYVKDDKSSVSAFQDFIVEYSPRSDVKLQNSEVISVDSITPIFPTDGYATICDLYTGGSTFYAQLNESDSMSNPTPFQSAPLLRAYGDGAFEMDGVTVTITGCDEYTDIDCELMDCYEGLTNRNNDVTFSTYNFPLLRSGDNEVNIISGITLLQITPRWWRI